MTKLLFNLAKEHPISESLSDSTIFETGEFERHQFPDGESYFRILSDCEGMDCVVFDSLVRPNPKVVDFLFAAHTLREVGASSVGAIVPYLPYMRQDTQFKEGEGITSKYFADMISEAYDWLVTVDPHLHRYEALDELYTLKTHVCESKQRVGAWICDNVSEPVVLGPDSESKQWVGAVAEDFDLPYTVLQKERRGDRDVAVSVPDPDLLEAKRPVIVDDIISTGRTMIETVKHLMNFSSASPICIGIHGIFVDNTFEELRNAGASRIVTTNSIPHRSNDIDLTPLFLSELEK